MFRKSFAQSLIKNYASEWQRFAFVATQALQKETSLEWKNAKSFEEIPGNPAYPLIGSSYEIFTSKHDFNFQTIERRVAGIQNLSF